MVESTALEMRRAGNGTVGSNPTLSASSLTTMLRTEAVWPTSSQDGDTRRAAFKPPSTQAGSRPIRQHVLQMNHSIIEREGGRQQRTKCVIAAGAGEIGVEEKLRAII